MRSRLVLVVAAGAVLLLVAVGAVTLWRRTHQGTEFAHAVALAPAGSERLGWTDWAAVRGADEPGSADELRSMLDAAYDADLSSASALATSAETLRDRFGVSPANLEWELFAQSPDGAALLLALPDGYSFDDLGDRLESLGFTPPEDDDGAWRGGADVVARVGGTLTPQLQHWVLLADDGIVVTSDTAEYAAAAAAAASGHGDRVEGLDGVVEASGSPTSAVVYAASYACERLAMAQADGPDQEQAAELVREAGTVSPLTAYAMAAQPDGDVRVAMSFETDEQARANADSRAALASGPAPGQGGDFADRFEVVSATAEESTVVLELRPVAGAYVVSDLSAGPVLFASC